MLFHAKKYCIIRKKRRSVCRVFHHSRYSGQEPEAECLLSVDARMVGVRNAIIEHLSDYERI